MWYRRNVGFPFPFQWSTFSTEYSLPPPSLPTPDHCSQHHLRVLHKCILWHIDLLLRCLSVISSIHWALTEQSCQTWSLSFRSLTLSSLICHFDRFLPFKLAYLLSPAIICPHLLYSHGFFFLRYFPFPKSSRSNTSVTFTMKPSLFSSL